MPGVTKTKPIFQPRMLYHIRQFSSIAGKRDATRFAPAPSGYLHLGHVASATYVWLIAKLCGARIQLRIEDHDRQRSKIHYEKAILEDLSRFDWKNDFRLDSPSRQSSHENRYREALEKLKPLVYACDCTRRSIESCFASHWQNPPEKRYLGVCRERGLSLASNYNLRLKLEKISYRIEDGFLGLIYDTPAMSCGDLLIRDRSGQWTYNFSTVVDNLHEDIDLVIRGGDLSHCVGRQIQLNSMLTTNESPIFFHHPLILDPKNGEKLSKRFLSTSIRSLFEAGWSSEEILGKACFLSGLTISDQPIRLEQLLGSISS